MQILAGRHVLGRRGIAVLALAGMLIAVPSIIRDQFYLHSIVLILLYSYLTSSWNIIGGFAGQVSLGHSVFFGLGAYTSSLLLLRWGITPWAGMLLGGVVAAVSAAAIGYPCFRLRGPYYTLSTLAFSRIMLNIVASTERFAGFHVRGAKGVHIPFVGDSPSAFQFSDKAGYYYVILALLAGVVGLSYAIRRSRLGFYLMAIRDDEDAASSVGINPARCKMYASMISAFLTALGGSFLAQFQLYVDPYQFFGVAVSAEMALASVIGGRGTIAGPVIGGLIMRSASEVARVYLGSTYVGAHLVLYGLVLILVIVFLPHGIVEFSQTIYPKLTTRHMVRTTRKNALRVGGDSHASI